MSSPTPENPPAFPHERWQYGHESMARHEGMTLRDYFAGQALVGPVRVDYLLAANRGEELSVTHMAALAYQLADAMLRVRSEGRS